MSATQKRNLDRASWNEVKDLFEKAIELPPSARRSFVESQTPRNPEIRAEIFSLLEQHVESQTRVATIRPEMLADSERTEDEPDEPEFRPTTVGKYLLVDRIGRGGMAEVYLGKITGAQGFEKLLAVKKIVSAFDPTMRKMFEFEAKLCSKLSHPNVVQVHDFLYAQSTYFIIMEFIQGKNLSEIMRQLKEQSVKLELELSLHIVNEISKALDYAHSAHVQPNMVGVIHRDISPKNVMVSYTGDVKLLDFGIARTLSTNYTTNTGTLAGTLQYMSPEQANGAVGDHRSDIFSLGVVLFELVSGRDMFAAETQVALLKQVQNYQLPELSISTLAIPEPLKESLRRSLARHPQERYATAAAFHFDIQQFLNREFTPFVGKRLAKQVCFLFEADRAREALRLKECEAKGWGPAPPTPPLRTPLRNTVKSKRRFSLVRGLLIVLVLVSVAFFKWDWESFLFPSVNLPRNFPSVQPPVGKCDALIQSEPSEAHLQVNGITIGATPVVVRVDCGRQVIVTLEKEGFERWQRKLEILDPRSQVKLSLVRKGTSSDYVPVK